jgi:hypothetical protein
MMEVGGQGRTTGFSCACDGVVDPDPIRSASLWPIRPSKPNVMPNYFCFFLQKTSLLNTVKKILKIM